MSDEDSKLTDNASLSLLAGAVEQAYFATHVDGLGTTRRFARYSILNCALFVESVANCLLFNLDFSNKTLKDWELKFKTLQKFEFYLQVSKKIRLDMGRLECQAMDELVTIRNDYVHPKLARWAAQHSTREKKIQVDSGMLDYLKIPVAYQAWDGQHAVTVLKSVDSFLTYLFQKQCEFSPDQVAEMLCYKNIVGEDKKLLFVGSEVDLIKNKAKALWSIDFACMDFTDSRFVSMEFL